MEPTRAIVQRGMAAPSMRAPSTAGILGETGMKRHQNEYVEAQKGSISKQKPIKSSTKQLYIYIIIYIYVQRTSTFSGGYVS